MTQVGNAPGHRSRTHKSSLPYSDQRRTKAAFESPTQQRDERGRVKPITHTDLGFDLEKVFAETDKRKKSDREEVGTDHSFERDYELPGSYKSFAKYEMHFDKETDL